MSPAPAAARAAVRACATAAVLWLSLAGPLLVSALAQQPPPDARARESASTPSEPPVTTEPPIPSSRQTITRVRLPESRPSGLPPLYVAFAGLQVLDAHSTLWAPRDATREVNPLMGALIDHPSLMYAVKVGTTTGTVYLAERLWKDGHRTASIALMVGVTSACTVVVASNYRHGPR